MAVWLKNETTCFKCVDDRSETVTVTGTTSYTFSLDIVDRSPVSNFSVELYTNMSNTITGATLKKTFASSELVDGTSIRYTQAFPTGTTYFFYKLVKASTEIARVKVDNLKFGKSTSRYKPVVVMKADYYPFGMLTTLFSLEKLVELIPNEVSGPCLEERTTMVIIAMATMEWSRIRN